MAQVADELEPRDVRRVDLRADRVDHDDHLVAVGVPVLRRLLDEVVADRDHEVGVGEAGELVVGVVDADRAERELVLEVQRALAHERVGDGEARRVRERPQLRRGARSQHAVAGEHDRVRGGADELGGARDLLGGRVDVDGVAARQRVGLQGRGHDVLGQLEVRRAGLVGLGDLERLAHGLRDGAGDGDARVPLRDRPHDLDDVDELV